MDNRFIEEQNRVRQQTLRRHAQNGCHIWKRLQSQRPHDILIIRRHSHLLSSHLEAFRGNVLMLKCRHARNTIYHFICFGHLWLVRYEKAQPKWRRASLMGVASKVAPWWRDDDIIQEGQMEAVFKEVSLPEWWMVAMCVCVCVPFAWLSKLQIFRLISMTLLSPWLALY